MILLGVDPHKSTHTATAVEPVSNQQVGSMRIEASLADYRRLLAWAKRWPQRKWAVENANGLGRHLAQWLIARGESVVDVPAAATSRVRELSRGGRRKNDQIDAAAAATVAYLQGEGRDLAPEDHTTALALLDERRVNLAQARVRTVNQLHALLRDLLPGGAPTQLSADLAAKLLRSVRPAGDIETVRKDIAWDLVAEIRKLDKQLTDNAARMQSLVEASSSTLMDTPGIGPVMAARLIGRTGRAHRFSTSAAFANYAGAAPVEIASADKARHRLSRSGDRQLNSVLHTIAVVQIRMPKSPGHAYYQRKLSEGKTPKEAKRCLKRRLADHVWRVMIADERKAKSLPNQGT
ncbi:MULTISPECIES: IS110 family transposase [unclassified Streptomyces]|uniref:IS110 family transposase n=1 Tax=unclassified Streptomyces TaxID=2593676 RepID=UPI00225944B7|nr:MULTISPECIES: IS110 family transposase [unclassified Streptomyces]WSP59577.1 IS110 family transposase [Streptomyces sp. NBC_01241]WSU19673.1 IS110 family transposase [Streptomyces sp. NBC_01108]MCX4792665.1 IS110 family transposase [Streptomyces sp. NBC_01242]WSP59643.1 IS110 family transposase [Streptomyces sp. NBC_01241]WSP60599.1 IS110 family transposase [Streptomyces sp. NBC_01240]